MNNQEAIRIIQTYIDIKSESEAEALDLAIKALEERPTAHNCNENFADCDQFVCSKCGIELQDWYRVEYDEDGNVTYHEYVFNYCPNCGRKIEEDE